MKTGLWIVAVLTLGCAVAIGQVKIMPGSVAGGDGSARPHACDGDLFADHADGIRLASWPEDARRDEAAENCVAGVREDRNDRPDRLAQFSNRSSNCAGRRWKVNMQSFIARVIGAARLNSESYEEVEADKSATGPAIAVVVVSSLAAAIGSGAVDPRSIAGMLVAAILSWLIWVFLTLFIGTQLLPGKETQADFGQVLRTTGFSASVGILRIFGALPVVGLPIFVLVTVWMLFTFVVAIRQALDYNSTMRAFAVCLLGWVIHAIVFFGFVRSVI